MGFIKFLKNLWQSMQGPKAQTYGMSDEQFTYRVLKVCPPGSKIFLDNCEPVGWRNELKQWAYVKDPKKPYEIEHYRIDEQFTEKFMQLISEDPKGFFGCHEFFIEADDGRLLLLAVDNFWMVEVAPEIRNEM